MRKDSEWWCENLSVVVAEKRLQKKDKVSYERYRRG